MSNVAQKVYVIKPLAWTHCSDGLVIAYTSIGNVILIKSKHHWYIERCLNKSSTDRNKSERFSNLEDAKAVAEKWYQEQLEQALNQKGECNGKDDANTTGKSAEL